MLQYNLKLGSDLQMTFNRITTQTLPTIQRHLTSDSLILDEKTREVLKKRLAQIFNMWNLISKEICMPFIRVNSRQTRGLVDVGGYLLQTVFGVETEHHVAELTNKLRHQIVVNDRHVRKLSGKVRELVAGTNALASNLRQLDNSIHAIRKTEDLILELDFITRQLGNVRDFCVELQTRKSNAYQGIINWDWIEDEVILREIVQMSREWALVPLLKSFEIEGKLADMVSGIKITTKVQLNTIQYLFFIPFGTNNSFTRTILTPFPSFDNETSSFHLIKLDRENLFVDQNSYFTDDKNRVCRNQWCFNPVIRNEPTCETQITHRQTPVLCSYQSFSPKLKIISLTNSFAIFNPNKSRISTKCANNTSVARNIVSNIAVVIPKACSFKIEDAEYKVRTSIVDWQHKITTLNIQHLSYNKSVNHTRKFVREIEQLNLDFEENLVESKNRDIGISVVVVSSLVLFTIGLIIIKVKKRFIKKHRASHQDEINEAKDIELTEPVINEDCGDTVSRPLGEIVTLEY